MGVWSATITGNDTARDLKSEYQAAFFYYDIDTALTKIDQYVRDEWFTESDEGEWCNYYYSLADYMWNKGILTDSVRDKAVQMIDSGFGLELWAEEGEKLLVKRKKALAEFRKKITSPQGEKKKIRVDLYTTSIFELGDIVTFQLKTDDKIYLPEKSRFSEDFFRKANGKYVVARKVIDHISYSSHVVPEVADHWCVFQLYRGVFDTPPSMSDLKNNAWFNINHRSSVFICESNMFYFKKRNYGLIGNEVVHPMRFDQYKHNSIFFGINNSYYNADTQLINFIISGDIARW